MNAKAIPGPDARHARRSEWGAQIRLSRENARITRADLAKRLGASAESLRAWESGRRGLGLVMRRKLCAELGIPPYLLDADRDHCPHCRRPWHA